MLAVAAAFGGRSPPVRGGAYFQGPRRTHQADLGNTGMMYRYDVYCLPILPNHGANLKSTRYLHGKTARPDRHVLK